MSFCALLNYIGDAEMGGHLRLRDDTILQLKQEGYAMQKRIKELTSENDELKRQLSPAIAFTTESDGMQVHNHYSIPIHTRGEAVLLG